MHQGETHADMQESLRKWAERYHLGVVPASVAAEVVTSAWNAPFPGLPSEAIVANLSPEQSSWLVPLAGARSRKSGHLTSWSSEWEGWETRGCAEWRSSPEETGRVAKTPRPADSVRDTRIGGGPRAAAAAAAVERRRRRRNMSYACQVSATISCARRGVAKRSRPLV
jgi:hypothetical protein